MVNRKYDFYQIIVGNTLLLGVDFNFSNTLYSSICTVHILTKKW